MENSENQTVKPLNLFQKLLEIQRKINGLGKDKDTSNPNNKKGYKYVTGDKVLTHVKPLMNEYGLLLKQEILNIDNQRQDYNTSYGTKAEILSKVTMKFTWIDCDTGERDENLFGANGQNDWEKGLGSALTYGERYFLLKYFHIATDEDDIDNPDRKTSAPVQQKVQEEQPQEYLLPGSKEDTISVALFEKITKIDHQNLPLANELLKVISSESKPVQKFFNSWCLSKAMKYDVATKQYEPIGIAVS